MKMEKQIALVLMVTLASIARADDFAKHVDITTTYTGGDVSDFPVLVKITSTTPTGFYTDVQNAGADLKFTDDTGAGDYPFEIDTWNASGDSYIWVKLPKLSAGMTFRMYYGNAEKTAPTTPTAVWSGYDLVCHVNGNANDSTANAHEGKLNPEGTEVTGMVGGAYGTTSANTVMANTLYSGSTGGDLENGKFSYSFWIRPTVALATFSHLAGPRNSGSADAWALSTYNPTTKLRLWTTKDIYCEITGIEFPITEWHKVDVAMNDQNVALYIDGALKGSATLTSAAKRCWVGAMAWGGYTTDNNLSFSATNGVVADYDECRIFSTVADANRVKADYETVANVATFLSFGEPQGGVKVLPSGVVVY